MAMNDDRGVGMLVAHVLPRAAADGAKLLLSRNSKVQKCFSYPEIQEMAFKLG